MYYNIIARFGYLGHLLQLQSPVSVAGGGGVRQIEV